MAALTVEHANASSSIYLFAPQISQKMVEHLKVLNSRAPKGPYGRAPKGSIYLLGGGAYGRACLRILNSRAPKGPLLSLMVEPPKGSSPYQSSPCRSWTVECANAPSLYWLGHLTLMTEIPSIIIYVISDDHYHYLRHYLRHFRRSLSMSFLSSPLPYGRAPKGDGGLISRACLRILISRAP